MAEETILIKIAGESTGFNKAVGSSMGSIAGLAGKLLGLGTAGIVLEKMAKEALDVDVNFSRLKTTMANTSDGTTQLFDKMKQLSAQQTLTAGFTESQMAGAFTKLVQNTNSSKVAMESMNATMELARGKGIELETAANIVTRAYEKGTKAVSRQTGMYGENIKGMAAVDALQKHFAGNVAAYAATSRGELDATASTFLKLGANGIKPIVAITADLGKGLAEAAEKGVDKFKPFKGIIDDIINVLREVVGVILPTLVYAIETEIATTFTRLKNTIYDLMTTVADAVVGNWKKVGTDMTQISHDYMAFNLKKDFEDVKNFAIQRQKEEEKAFKASKDNEVKVSKDAADANASLNQVTASDAIKGLKDLASLKKVKSKEMFEIGKAASIASIIASTAEAIMKDLALGPWGIPLSIAAGAAGAVELATASGTTFSAANGLYNDTSESMKSTFQPREVVIPQRFSDLIASGRISLHGGNSTQNNNSGGIVIHIHSNGLDNAHEITRKQILPALKHFLQTQRGGRLVKADGTLNW